MSPAIPFEMRKAAMLLASRKISASVATGNDWGNGEGNDGTPGGGGGVVEVQLHFFRNTKS